MLNNKEPCFKGIPYKNNFLSSNNEPLLLWIKTNPTLAADTVDAATGICFIKKVL